jgi:hypothetical protein
MREENKQPVKITQRITGWGIKKDAEVIEERLTREEWEQRYPRLPEVVNKFGIHEKVKRDPILKGETYQINTPKEAHSLYVTINDQIIDGERFPFEIFVNCKNMQHFQWVTALTKVISAVFRKGGDISFLIEELSNVFDPAGGHFTKGNKHKKGKFMPSLVAELGEVLRLHLEGLKEQQNTQIIGIPLENVVSTVLDVIVEETLVNNRDEKIKKPTGSLCPECYTLSMVMQEGCLCCKECGYSKCQ